MSKKDIGFTSLKTTPPLRILLQHPSSARINFYIGLVTVTISLIALVMLAVLNMLNASGTGIFWLLWLAMGAYLLVDSYRQSAYSVKVRAFAEENGFLAINDLRTGDYPGIYFRGNESRVVDAIRTPNQNFIEIGNYQVIKASGRDSRFQQGYVRMKLPRRLPHIVLSPRKAGEQKLYGKIDTGQTLSLEGNFDDHFTLYAPLAYERDALYIFTPDIMELFINRAGDYTCEIIDDELYLYSTERFNLVKPEVITEKLRILERLAPKFKHQIDYYADERIGDRAANVIAAPGQRLKGRLGSIFLQVFFLAITTGIVTFLASHLRDFIR